MLQIQLVGAFQTREARKIDGHGSATGGESLRGDRTRAFFGNDAIVGALLASNQTVEMIGFESGNTSK